MEFHLSKERFSCLLLEYKLWYDSIIQVNEAFIFLDYFLYVKSNLVSAYGENFIFFMFIIFSQSLYGRSVPCQ